LALLYIGFKSRTKAKGYGLNVRHYKELGEHVGKHIENSKNPPSLLVVSFSLSLTPPCYGALYTT